MVTLWVICWSNDILVGNQLQSKNKWSPTFIDCCEQNVLIARVVGTWTRVTGKNSALQKEPLFPNGKTYSKNLRISNFPWAHRLSFIFGNPCAYYFLWEPLTFFGNHHCIYCRNYWRCHIYQTILWTFQIFILLLLVFFQRIYPCIGLDLYFGFLVNNHQHYSLQ